MLQLCPPLPLSGFHNFFLCFVLTYFPLYLNKMFDLAFHLPVDRDVPLRAVAVIWQPQGTDKEKAETFCGPEWGT